MGFFDWLFGAPRDNESDTSEAISQPVRIARGRGFTFDVVGESHRQDVLDSICGGKCHQGHDLEVVAQLCFVTDNCHDCNAVGVFIDGQLVGYVPRDEAALVRSEILRINPDERPITCSAKIVGGWDRGGGDEGHYGVKLSISKPMRLA